MKGRMADPPAQVQALALALATVLKMNNHCTPRQTPASQQQKQDEVIA
jgi:hypothetical protein